MYTPEAATLAPGAGTASSSEIMPVSPASHPHQPIRETALADWLVPDKVPGWLRNHADQRRTNSVNSPLLDSPIPVSFPYATNAESDGEASPAMSGREKNSPVTHGLPFMTPELTSSRDLLQQYSPSRHAHVNAYNSGQHVAQGARGSCNQGAEHHGGDHVGNQLSGLSLWQHGIGMPANLPHPETSAPDQSQEYGQSFLFPESTEPSDPNLTTIQQQVFPLAEHLQYQQHQPKSPHAVLECAPLGTSDPFLASMGSLPPHHAFLQEQFSPANLAFLQYYMPLLPSQTHTASSTQQALLQNPVCFSHADFSSSPRFQASHQHAGDGAASWAQAYMAASTTALPNKVPPVRVEPQPPPLATPGTMEIINCVKKTACHAPEARATVLNHERAPSSDLHKGVSAQESTSYSSANATKEEELNFTDDLKAFCHCTPDSSAHHTADPSPASSSSFSPTTEKRIVNEDVGLAELLHHEDCIDVELLTSSIAVPGQDTLPKSEQHHGIDTGS